MKIERPQFELTRVFADGTSGAPEIIRVGCMPLDTRMERRGFLGVGVGVAAVLLLESACRSKSSNLPVKVPDSVLSAHRGSISSLAISADGKTLASGSGDQAIKLWSMPDGKLLSTLEGNRYRGEVNAVAISPDGKILASGSGDQAIKLWSLPEGKLLATLEGRRYQGGVYALAISADGKTLASGSDDQAIKLWSMPDGKLLSTLEGNRYRVEVNAVAISPDGKTLASGSIDPTIKLWSLSEGKLLAALEGHQGGVYALAISPDGKMLASGSADHTIKLWSLSEGKLLAALEGHQGRVDALAISPDGKMLASGSVDHTIKLWSLPEGKLVATLEGHKQPVYALVISPDGKLLASGDWGGVIILWDLEGRAFLSFLFDPRANATDAISYNTYDWITGQSITYTLPCGSAIPPGAVCTCNCVPGTYRPAPSGGSGVCTCDQVCTCIPVPSDREVKEAFETTDPLLILQKLSELPIQSWNYKRNNSSIRHIGPMAQDFAAAFAVGEDDKHIHPVDAQGVAFAAIQGLYRIVKEKEARTESLLAQLREQQKENEALKTRIEALEHLLNDPLLNRG